MVVAPIRQEWLAEPSVGVPNGDFGFACRLGLADAVEGELPLPDLPV